MQTYSLIALLAASIASGANPQNQRRHAHHAHGGVVHGKGLIEEVSIAKRGSGQCAFPTNVGLVAITPNEQNAGWAMSPNQPCTPGNWCPYACPPGQLSGQWDPAATSYTYPQSQYGGLYCDNNGNIQMPFPDKPYCYDGTGTVNALNSCSQQVAFCQTVLPGNEAMLIPTNVEAGSSQTLAVPDETYWAGTAAHYYINPPGVSTETACVWGTSENPWGNWSPYVAGANTDGSGNTYTKIGWNPIYLQPSTPFNNDLPQFGLRVVCEGNCVGLPCEIDPSTQGINQVNSGEAADGAGGAAFCVVTAQSGSKAHIEVFEVGSGGSSLSPSAPSSLAQSSAVSESSTLQAFSSSPASTENPQPPTSSSSPAPSTTSTSSQPAPPSTSSSASSSSSIGGVESVSSLPSPTGQDFLAQVSSTTSTSSPGPVKHSVLRVSDLFASSRAALVNVATNAAINTTTSSLYTSSRVQSITSSSGAAATSNLSSSAAIAASSTHKKNDAVPTQAAAVLVALIGLNLALQLL